MIEIQRKLLVSVIGDAQLHQDDVKFQHAYEAGRALVDNGFIGYVSILCCCIITHRYYSTMEHKYERIKV